MPSLTIDGANPTAVQILPKASSCDRGRCVVIANGSASDSIYVASDAGALQSAKSQNTNNYGIQIPAGQYIVIPWVTSAFFAINYNAGPNPTDVLTIEAWE